ncbi:MAG: 2-amino-4-hydroxy-6-hydroxymethyldihydropteridine diphosphokinase [Brumimicrobium sp.]|nr:2-amino-4-hydroxy-6-hydroxymethyldihydropteridine diphosphokinase [Brumimicrobium sp.]
MDYHTDSGKKIFLSLGSNLGERLQNLDRASKRLEQVFKSKLTASSVYESPPWGYESNNAFLNQCVGLKSELSPLEVLQVLQQVENEMGRKRKSNGAYCDRIIDIDLLYYENEHIEEENLKIPHPKIYERKFVLKPLAEIAPNLLDPLKNKEIQDLLTLCNDQSDLILYKK